jgi:hypothetical protein
MSRKRPTLNVQFRCLHSALKVGACHAVAFAEAG